MLLQSALQPILFEPRKPSIHSVSAAQTTIVAASTYNASITIPAICNCMVVVAHWGRNADSPFSSITYNSQALTLDVNSGTSGASNRAYCAIAHIFNPPTAQSLTLAFTVSANYDQASMQCFFLRDVSSIHTTNSASRTADGGTSYSINLATTKPSLIIGGRCGNRSASAITGTPGAGYGEQLDAPLNTSQWSYTQSKYNYGLGTVAFDITASATWGVGNTDSIAAMALV